MITQSEGHSKPVPASLCESPAAARRAFVQFVERLDPAAHPVALHDSDADGVTAGVLWQRAFERAGFKEPLRVIPDRLRDAWSADSRERTRTLAPDALFVLDLGIRSEAVLPGVPTCFIDHHRPESPDARPGDAVISAYGWEVVPNTSLLVWDLVGSIADVKDLDWIAAIGTLSDLGEGAPFDLLGTAKHRYSAKYLKEATALVNSGRRASHYSPEAAARALLDHPDPKALVLSNTPEVQQLRAAREEVGEELAKARRVAPVFAGNVALIRLHSPCQVHPLIAQSWRSRLPGYIVIAANDGYLEGRVNFAARTASGVNLLDFFGAIDLPEGEGSYGQGHDQASGGVLPIERWNALLEKLGFDRSIGS